MKQRLVFEKFTSTVIFQHGIWLQEKGKGGNNADLHAWRSANSYLEKLNIMQSKLSIN